MVYEAHDRERDTVVALKALKKTDGIALYWFKREFRTLADLTHPNLVTLYELISDSDQWFLAMELVRGVDFLSYVLRPDKPSSLGDSSPLENSNAATVTSLADSDHGRSPLPRKQISGTLDPDRLRSGLQQLAEGVSFLHRNGILHRDIKPSNVLVTDEGRVVLLDFGLATDAAPDDRGESLMVIGTPAYMSPEQAGGRPLSEASDWYGVGVILYRALTGQLPFDGSDLTVLHDKQHVEPTPPGEVVTGLPDDLELLCRDLLRLEPSSRPNGSEVLTRLGAAVPRVTQKLPSRKAPPFVGRARELATLSTALTETRRGRAEAVYIRGASGMGKTALVQHFIRTIQESQPEAVVLTGRCYEQEAVPYKALDGLIDSLTNYLKMLPDAQAQSLLPRGLSSLARVFPVLQRLEAAREMRLHSSEIPDSQELRRRASTAFREMLGRIAERFPLILFIDDLQWGDVDSASLLTDLLRPPDQPPLLLIACYRGEEADGSEIVRTLTQPDRPTRDSTEISMVDVGELQPEEAADLARTLIEHDGTSKWQPDLVARESGGSPFFIDQLVRHGAPRENETTLDAVLRDSVSRLTPTARTLLELAAVAGRPIELAVANRAAGLPMGDYDVVSSLRARHFLRTRRSEARREIEPYHDRIRETIVASLPASLLMLHHRRLASALEESERADPEALAVHFHGAGDLDKAAHYALEAAEKSARALAFERAARLYRMTLQLRPPNDPNRGKLLAKLGDALANGGRVIEAADAYVGAADMASPVQRRELLRQAGEQFLMGGHLDRGLALLESVLAKVDLKLPTTSRQAIVQLLAREVQLRVRGTGFRERHERDIPADALWRIDLCRSVVRSLGFTDTVKAVEFQKRHLLLALKIGEPNRIALALSFEATAAARNRRSRARGERLLKQARDLVAGTNNPDHHASLCFAEGMMAYLAGRWRVARDFFESAERTFRDECALPYQLLVCQLQTLGTLHYGGQLAEYFRRVPPCLAESLDRGSVYAEANLRLHDANLKCFVDDDPATAVAELKEAMARWSPRGFHLEHAAELFRWCDFAIYRGEPQAAIDRIADRWPALKSSFLLELELVHVWVLYLRARAALAVGAEGGAARQASFKSASQDAHRIERLKTPWGMPLAQMVHAAVAMDEGDLARARELLVAAETEFERLDMTSHAAIARHRRGALVGGDEGRSLTAKSDQWMSAQGLANPARFRAMLSPGRWAIA